MGFSLLTGISEPGEPASQFRIIIDTNLLNIPAPAWFKVQNAQGEK
jgi:hypothetical protein